MFFNGIKEDNENTQQHSRGLDCVFYYFKVIDYIVKNTVEPEKKNDVYVAEYGVQDRTHADLDKVLQP